MLDPPPRPRNTHSLALQANPAVLRQAVLSAGGLALLWALETAFVFFSFVDSSVS